MTIENSRDYAQERLRRLCVLSREIGDRQLQK